LPRYLAEQRDRVAAARIASELVERYSSEQSEGRGAAAGLASGAL